jgi:SAM-dependent methyltransferase
VTDTQCNDHASERPSATATDPGFEETGDAPYSTIRGAVEVFARGIRPGARVLDVGCGLRPYEPLFAHASYTGMDVRSSGREMEGKLADVFFDGVAIPFRDESFHAVLCTEVLEHAVSPDSLLAEIHRVLVRGGRLCLTVPFIWGIHEGPYDFRRYSTFGIRAALEEAGLEVEALHRLTRGADAVATLVASEINNSELRRAAAKRVGGEALRRRLIVASNHLWRLQLRLWRWLYDFERIYIDNAVIARKP